VTLLLRTARHVAPTGAGRVFLERTRQILGDLDEAENAARGAGGLRGTLRGALSGGFGTREVIPVCLTSRRSIRKCASSG
jgi:DNA-binding transcriptional LysR family regulator